MTTEAQIKANQENAKKSTGPTSIEGKKRSSMNAVTHGILSSVTALPGEDQDVLDHLREGVLATYRPQDTMEQFLVDRIYKAMVRQIRLCEAEAAKLKISMSAEALNEGLLKILRQSGARVFSVDQLTEDGRQLLEDMKIIHRIPQGVDVTLMTRYQVQLDNDLYRAMNALQKYRDNKAKLIEGEVVDDIEASEEVTA
jgi:hypothetical protein